VFVNGCSVIYDGWENKEKGIRVNCDDNLIKTMKRNDFMGRSIDRKTG
jgi:hypothetical protein